MDTGRISATVGSGKAVISGSTTTFVGYAVTAPWNRTSLVNAGNRVAGSFRSNPVGPHGDINGTIYGQDMAFDHGSIIMLTSSRAMSGFNVEDGCIFLRVRHGAAFIQARGLMPSSPHNRFGEAVSMFMGTADILSVDEVEVLGIRVPRGWVVKFCQPEQVQKRFDIMELAPETIPRPEFTAISTASGVVIRELAAVPSRRVRLRR